MFSQKIPGKTPSLVHRNDAALVQSPGDFEQVFPRQYGVEGEDLPQETTSKGTVSSAAHSYE